MRNAYIKKIEKYIANKSSKKPVKKGTGLLSPDKEIAVDKENVDMDIVAQMAEFVLEIRKMRMELKNGKKSRS